MLSLLGYTLTFGEILGFLGVIAGGFGAYYRITQKIGLIEERNTKADKTSREMRQDLSNIFTEKMSALEARLYASEERVQRQEVFMSRIDERLLSMQNLLEDIRRQGAK